MAPTKRPRVLLGTLASCLLLLQLTLPCAQAIRPGPIAGLHHRSLRATQANDIPMAPLGVLNASLFAANLSSMAYPESFLSDSDAEGSYTDPTLFQKYATALTAATSAYSRAAPTFVQRLSDSILSPTTSARFLYAFVLPTDAAIYVTFRGTDLTGYVSVYDKISALVDANTLQTPFTYANAAAGNVHTGFYMSLTDPSVDSYDSNSNPNSISAYQQLRNAIKAAQGVVGSSVPIVLTGHSLGAAQASLAAFMLSLDGFNNLQLITFGNPQIGDAAWRKAFDAALGSKHMAWWNMQDPVVQVPNIDEDPGCDNINGHDGGNCVQNWFTAGTRYRIDKVADGSLRCGQPTGTYAVCDDRSDSKAPLNKESCYTQVDVQSAFAEPDHNISNYIGNLQACIVAVGGTVGGK